MVDPADSKSAVREGMRVRLQLSAQKFGILIKNHYICERKFIDNSARVVKW